jgi:hypothetical protein
MQAGLHSLATGPVDQLITHRVRKHAHSKKVFEEAMQKVQSFAR